MTKVHLRPILSGLANIIHGRILPDVGEGFLVVRRQQSLVGADRCDARLDRLFIERIHHLLVVQTPREFGRRKRIANRVGLPRIRLVDLDIALSTSSIQPGCLGVITVWASRRLDPAKSLTICRVLAICSLESSHHVGSSNGAPLSSASWVSLS